MRKQLEHWKCSTITIIACMQGIVGDLHRKLGWKVRLAKWGFLSLCRTHAYSSHGCYWQWHTSLNGFYWKESSRSSARPQSTSPSFGDGCWVVAGWWCETGFFLQVCVWMASSFIVLSPPFFLPPPPLIILSVSLCSRPDTTLTPTPFSFCLCSCLPSNCFDYVWARASSAVSYV